MILFFIFGSLTIYDIVLSLFGFYSVLIEYAEYAEYAEFILNYFAIDSAKRRGLSGLFSPCENYDLRLDNYLLQ